MKIGQPIKKLSQFADKRLLLVEPLKYVKWQKDVALAPTRESLATTMLHVSFCGGLIFLFWWAVVAIF
jgi:hypothetical protein